MLLLLLCLLQLYFSRQTQLTTGNYWLGIKRDTVNDDWRWAGPISEQNQGPYPLRAACDCSN